MEPEAFVEAATVSMQLQKFSVQKFCGAQDDLDWMGVALQQARLAEQLGEVPIGAALVMNGELVTAAHNSPVSRKNACAHAEILAIEQGCRTLDNYRLGKAATLYITLQPCLMCLGAILHARIGRVVVGCEESRYNSHLEGALQAFQHSSAWHACRFETGCRAVESESLLSGFFRSRRRHREQSVSELASLMHLPNANKETIAELCSLGLGSPADLLQKGLDDVAAFMTHHAELLLKQNRTQQAAIFLSLADFFRGEPVQSWKNYL